MSHGAGRPRLRLGLVVTLLLALSACEPPPAKPRDPKTTSQSAPAPMQPAPAPGEVVLPPEGGADLAAAPPTTATTAVPAAPGQVLPKPGQPAPPPSPQPTSQTQAVAPPAPAVATAPVAPATGTPPPAPVPNPMAFPRRSGRLDLTGARRTFGDEFHTFDWDEQFYGMGPRQGRWRTSYMNGDNPDNLDNRTLPGNRELQVYMDASFPKEGGRPFGIHPFEIINGDVLRITANPASPQVRARAWGRPYTSGVITSWGSFSQKYGVFQLRAKTPRGHGLWPAFWMLKQEGGWPPEIDIMEILGQTPDSLYTAVHTRQTGRHRGKGETTTVPDTSADFHTYTVDWGPRDLIFYFDDVEVFRHPTPRDMHKPMFLIVNLAVGGKWPGAPNRETQFPAHLDVDWVRAWQRGEYPR